MPSVCAQAPGEKTNPAIGSTGMGVAEDRRIPARWGPSGPGARLRGVRGSLGIDCRGLAGPEWRPARSSAAPSHGGR
jgi:hypothetical protein